MNGSSIKDSKEGLAQILGLKDRPGVFRDLKVKMRKMVVQNFDTAVVYSEQDPAKIAEVKRQISQHFPDVFEHPSFSSSTCEKRAKAIMFYAQKYLGAIRHRSVRDGPNKDEQSNSGGPQWEPPTLPTPLRSPLSSSASTVGAQPTSSGSGQTIIESPDADTEENLPTTDTDTPSAHMPQSAVHLPCPPPPSYTSSAPANVPIIITPKTTSAATPLRNNRVTPHEYRIDQIAIFLRSCAPSMEYLLNSFIEYGCRSREFLVAIAQNWTDEEIDAFLKDLVIVDGGQVSSTSPSASDRRPSSRLTNMDIRILTRHLRMLL
ncbi:hypothetical protein P691DRAFT_764811 [Macrolepiota fuliginosa MF-IS2]|uniref:Uncharacterized protein n=1 Tax=Macrolepiota fuliginosa MF-IS2 TaxID=1400762 RepID=A0A9P6BWG2_9AGAR|nr:hypothetical protein P691DRAFT_764811 [Macrolepiota fuliginosa MF-IS2]